MRRHALPFALGLALAALSAAAEAQTAYSRPAPGGYGGGLVEFLMTGRSAPAQAPVYGAPRRYAGYPAEPARVAPEFGLGSEYRRQVVAYDGPERPGTIVVDTPAKHLYLVQAGGQALRYGIGVGRPGFMWAGTKTVTMKREWPAWTPPSQMLARRPDLPRHMEGGPENPLGARALYLGSSLYRIHGTNEPGTIGQNVSSGCIRMMNEDVSDLYERVRVGTVVKVI